jgi:hypothetical protein
MRRGTWRQHGSGIMTGETVCEKLLSRVDVHDRGISATIENVYDRGVERLCSQLHGQMSSAGQHSDHSRGHAALFQPHDTFLHAIHTITSIPSSRLSRSAVLPFEAALHCTAV